MWVLLVGLSAFGLISLFDYNKLRWNCKWLNGGFGAGVLLLFLSTLQMVFGAVKPDDITSLKTIVFLLLSGAALFGMMWALFFAIPFRSSYLETGQGHDVIDTGLYALCRHPGVLFFWLVYLFLWLATAERELLLALVFWGGLDILHVWWQDRFVFPQILNGYTKYQRETPFLIPRISSLKRCLKGFERGVDSSEAG